MELQPYRDPALAKGLIADIRRRSRRSMRIMEVCGTHTMALYRNGIPSILPPTVTLLSGPGCPVCVTSQDDIDAFIRLSEDDRVILATFGDLLRVPGSMTSLHQQRAKGKDIRIIYSPLDALDMARAQPAKSVVLAGVGFETTAPLTAAAIAAAASQGLHNFHVYSSHKRMIPALEALLSSGDTAVDGFLLPGHVSVIIGADAYRPVIDRFRVPAVIAGFESVDILYALSLLVNQWERRRPELENAYPRAVNAQGNLKALAAMNQIYQTSDARWRGLGIIAESGMEIREAYARYDARKAFSIPVTNSPEPAGCLCGDVLTGRITPAQCPLFGKTCMPAAPVGPCMVSSEGTCAAHYRYGR